MNKNEWIDKQLLHAFEREGTTAHRLCTIDNSWVERLGNDVLISFQNKTERERLLNELLAWSKSAPFKVRRVFVRLLPRQNEDRLSARLIFGQASEDLRAIATERNLRFTIDFGAGYSTGLFLDQRENRSHLRKIRPKRLLNCFAYTCSFSVAAASVGSQTVNIDLSGKWLARGRENFQFNEFSTNGHRFIEDDVRPVLQRFVRRGETFDAIILDPPTFSRSSIAGTFRIERDLGNLLSSALVIAGAGCHILLSTNCATLTISKLEKLARSCLAEGKRTANFHRTKCPADFPAASAARSIWLSLD